MIFRLAWQLWRYRIWQSVRISFIIAVLVLAALSAFAWLYQQQLRLDADKRDIAVSLVLEGSVTADAARALAADLQSLAPSLVERIEIISDSALIERIQSRHGIALSDLLGDSIVPMILRVHFVSSALDASSLAAFIEECRTIPDIADITYPVTRSVRVFEEETRLRWIGGAAVALWLVVVGVVLWLYFRSVLPLVRRERESLVLLGASAPTVRLVRMLYASYSIVVGMAIAAAIVAAVWLLHIYPSIGPTAIAVAGAVIASVVAVVGIAAGFAVEPK